VWKFRPASPAIYSDDDGGKKLLVPEQYGVTNWDLYGLVLFSAVSYVFFGMVRNCLDHGLTPGYTLDIFAINLFSQFILCFTRYGWYIYMLVPGYIGYKVLGYLWAYIGSSTSKDQQQQEAYIDAKEKKRQEKKERQAA
jgi:hypothetical protein